jgi:integrase/recombinase XerC
LLTFAIVAFSISEHPQARSFLAHLRFEKRFSPHTLAAYEEDLRQFLEYILVQYELTDPTIVKPIHVRSWMADLSSRGLKARSVNRKLSCIRSFYGHGRRSGVFASDPCRDLRLLKVPRRLPVQVEESGMRVLMEEVAFPEGFEGSRERIIIELLYGTGMRISELLRLRDSDIDLRSSSVRVMGKGGKERVIPLGPRLLDRIREHLGMRAAAGVGQAYLVEKPGGGGPMNPRTAYGIVRRYLSLVTTSEKRGPHVLRHSFATHLTDRGADLGAVKDLLGHSSLAATQIYTHNSISKLLEAHRKAHPKGQG